MALNWHLHNLQAPNSDLIGVLRGITLMVAWVANVRGYKHQMDEILKGRKELPSIAQLLMESTVWWSIFNSADVFW